MDGLALSKNSSFPKINPLPPTLKHYVLNGHNNFRKNSSFYNNVLAFSSIGVDNGRNGVGFEKINGNHAVKLNGRTYHTLNRSDKKNVGINYFTYDALQELRNNCKDHNEKKSTSHDKQLQFNGALAANKSEFSLLLSKLILDNSFILFSKNKSDFNLL